ncbi:MAG: hypothetical protein JST54_18845 [Deltaproteobacteria bacterium]|nr:hypothetical protein [Deltaproteobacteria bacterium]
MVQPEPSLRPTDVPASPPSVLPAARLLVQAAAWLMVIGLATGGLASSAMTGQLPADPHAALASHLNGLLGALWMVAVSWSMPMLRYGPVGQRRLALGLIVANYANWLVTAVKAFLHVAGVGPSADLANNAVFGALTVFVVTPALASALAWALGFRKA